MVPLDAPDAISQDLAPAGFKVINKHRSDGDHGSGLTIIHRDHLIIQKLRRYHTFEVFVVKLVIGAELLSLVNTHRPPSASIIQFIDELSDLDDPLSAFQSY